MPRVHLVDQVLDVLDERAGLPVTAAEPGPVTSVGVFGEPGSAIIELRPHLLERGDLLAHAVAAIVDHYVGLPGLASQGPQERAVSLVPGQDRDLVTAEGRAARVNVHAGDLR